MPYDTTASWVNYNKALADAQGHDVTAEILGQDNGLTVSTMTYNQQHTQIKKLPQTGNDSHSVLFLAAMGLISMFAGMLGLSKKN